MEKQAKNGLQTQVIVNAKLNPFVSSRSVSVRAPGDTLMDIVLAEYPDGDPSDLNVAINGTVIQHRFWLHTKPKSGSIVTLQAVPRGDNAFRTVATIAVIAAAAWVTGGAALPGGAALIGSSTAAGFAGAATAAVGMLAVNALIPIKEDDFDSRSESQALRITGGRNQARQYEPVPQILGTYRFTPPLAAPSYTHMVGDNQHLTMLLMFGYGPLQIWNHRIGSNAANNYRDIEVQVRNGYLDDIPMDLYQGIVLQDPVGIRVFYGADSGAQCDGEHPDPGNPPPNQYIRTTRMACSSFDVNYSFPSGIIQIKDQGDRSTRGVTLRVSYRISGDTDWIVAETKLCEAETTSPIYGTIKVIPDTLSAEVPYDVMMERILYDSDTKGHDDCEGVDSDGNNHKYSASWWDSLTMYSTQDAVQADLCLATVALNVRATNQLQGAIDQYSADCKTVLLVYSGTPGVWSKGTSNNPADIYRHVLQGQANKRGLRDCRIYEAGIEAFHDWCRVMGFTYNAARDYRGTVEDTLRDIAAAGRGRPGRVDGGLHTVVFDDQTRYETPVQLFAEGRNAWGFSTTRQFIDSPHAFNVRFVDAEDDYQQKDITVYDSADGYSESNATIFESLPIPGKTNTLEVTRMAEYRLNEARLRQSTYKFTTDFQHLACTSGDAIYFASDAIAVSIGTARIIEISGTDITLDTTIRVPDDPAARIMTAADGSASLKTITSATGLETATITVDSVPEFAEIGDMVTIGESGSETLKLVIDRIIPANDGSATIYGFDVAIETAQTTIVASPASSRWTAADVTIE